MRIGARRPGATVEPALEGRAALGRAELKSGGPVVVRVRGLRVDRGLWWGEVEGPRVARRRRIGVAGGVGGANAERVAALGQSGRHRVRARARRPGAAIDAALEARAALAGRN